MTGRAGRAGRPSLASAAGLDTSSFPSPFPGAAERFTRFGVQRVAIVAAELAVSGSDLVAVHEHGHVPAGFAGRCGEERGLTVAGAVQARRKVVAELADVVT